MSRISLSRIDLRVLSVFLHVVEHEGFSSAALALDTSLSTVTRDVSSLETRLGVRLCRRGRGGFSLTPQGEEIYRAARQLMEDVRGFESRIAAARETLPGALEIGLIDNMASNPDCLVTESLADLRRQMPDLDLRVGVHPVTSIDVLVRERRIDIGFTGKPDFLTPLRYIPAYDEVHSLFVSRDCPDYERIVRWRPESDGPPIPYVVRTFPSKPFQLFEASMPFRVTAVGNSLEGVLAAVAAGFGAGILPAHAAKPFPRLVPLPFPDGGLRVPFFIVVRKDSERQPAIGAFLKAYRKRSADTGALLQV